MGMSSWTAEGCGSIPPQNRDPLERAKGSVVIPISKRVPRLRVFVEGVGIVEWTGRSPIGDGPPNTYRDSAAVALSGPQESGGARLTALAF